MWINSKNKARLARLWPFLALLLLTACSSPAFKLAAQATQKGKNIEVNGTSNLPDKAIILVSLLDPNKPADMNRNVITQEFGLVKTGKFTATLKPLQTVAAGKYQLRLRFSPNASDSDQQKVTEVVGPKGEKLTGPQVISDENGNMLLSTQEIDYKP